MKKTGLVFSGGGGKGAYAIGVWKALQEFGLDTGIKAVSGTSVGGLNGALFVQGDIEKAERLWLDIARDKILQLDLKLLAEKIAKVAASMAIPGIQGKVALQIANFLQGKGWFSQDGLERLIKESGTCQVVSESGLPFYVCALNKESWQLAYPHLNQFSDAEITQWLLATSAIPGVFSKIEIGEHSYWDGGVLPGGLSNNTPFQPLIEKEGCTHIINIYLDRSPDTVNQRDYPNTRFWNIIPSEEFDGLISALNFSPENAQKLIELGYRDVSSMLKRFQDFMDDEERFLNALCDMQESHHGFVDQIAINQSLRLDTGRASPDASSNNSDLTTLSRDPLTHKELMDKLAVTITDQERKLIQTSVDALIEEAQESSEELLEDAFTAITTLATNEGRINSQLEQSVFGRILGTLSGSQARQQAEINNSFHTSLYATQSLIQKLNQKQALGMELMASLSNKCNYLMSHINMLYGAVNSLEQQQLQNFKLFSQGVQTLADEVEQRFTMMTGRVERLEYKQALDDWYHEIRNLPLSQPSVERLLQATAGFYEASGRSWEASDLNRYRSALKDLDVSDQTFSAEQLFTASSATALAHPLDTASIFPVAPDKEHYHTLLKGVQVSLETQGSEVVSDWQRQLPVPVQVPVTGERLGIELLYSLRRNDRRSPGDVAGARSPLKDVYLAQLSVLDDIAAEAGLGQGFTDNLNYLRRKITDFKVVVPVIGKFSAGKSTLLNRYLGRDFLASDITPETAIATEIAYGEQESVILNYQDGRTEERSFAALKDVEVTDDLAFLQVFINNPRLFHRPDLVLVDMPGFDARNQSHHKAIAWYLHRGDFFINLMPSDAPFDASVMEQLAEIRCDYRKEVACLISKAGRRSPGDLAKLQAELATTLEGYLQQDITPLAIEATAPGGSIKGFEDALDTAVRNYDQLLAGRFEDELVTVVRMAEQRITSHLHALTSDELEIEQKIQDEEAAFKKTQQELQSCLNDLQYNLCSTGRERLVAEAEQILQSNTGSLVRAAKSRSLSQEVTTLVRPVVQYELQALIEQELTALQGKLEAISLQEGMIHVDLHIPPEEKEMFSVSSAAIAAGIARVVLGPVGAIVSGILGGFLGSKDNAEERERQIREGVTHQVIPEAVQKVADHINTQLQSAVRHLSQKVNEQLENEASDYRNNLQLLQKKLGEAGATLEEQQQRHYRWLEQLNGSADALNLPEASENQ